WPGKQRQPRRIRPLSNPLRSARRWAGVDLLQIYPIAVFNLIDGHERGGCIPVLVKRVGAGDTRELSSRDRIQDLPAVGKAAVVGSHRLLDGGDQNEGAVIGRERVLQNSRAGIRLLKGTQSVDRRRVFA